VGKAAALGEADYSALTSAEVTNGGTYHHSPKRLHDMVFNYLSTGTTLPFNFYLIYFIHTNATDI
jgi:hypothetical protein